MPGFVHASVSGAISDLLKFRANSQPERMAYALLRDGSVATSLTYRALDEHARAIANILRRSDIDAPVLLLYPAGLDFITAFFGCLYAGAKPIPLFPPRRNRPDRRLAAIIADSKARIGLLTSSVL